MKIAFLTNLFDRTNLILHPKSVGYYMIKYLRQNGAEVEIIPFIQPSKIIRLPYKIKENIYKNIFNKTYMRCCNFALIKRESEIRNEMVKKSDADFVISFGPFASVFLETDKKVAFWTDAMLQGLLNPYYYNDLCDETIKNNFIIDELGIKKASSVFFTSNWAKNHAIDVFPDNADNYLIAPFGANMEFSHDLYFVENLIEKRLQNNICKLLFVGLNWKRKGADVAIAIIKRLNELGLKSELTIIGCEPPTQKFNIPDCVRIIKYIDMHTNEGMNTMFNYYKESHFFLMRTFAETFGHVFCEANAFGLPCISHRVGGVPEVILDGKNGQLFEIGEDINHWCEYIIKTFEDKNTYKELCLSSFNEYKTRLNWDNGCKIVVDKLKELI